SVRVQDHVVRVSAGSSVQSGQESADRRVGRRKRTDPQDTFHGLHRFRPARREWLPACRVRRPRRGTVGGVDDGGRGAYCHYPPPATRSATTSTSGRQRGARTTVSVRKVGSSAAIVFTLAV